MNAPLLLLAILGAALIGSVGVMVLSIVRQGRSPGDPAARFQYGWMGTYALMIALASCLGMAIVLVVSFDSSVWAVVALAVVNLLVQPVALLFCWAGIRKIVLGLRGNIAYAWRRVPESELVDMPPAERRALAWFCVFQGLLGLGLGAVMSYGCAAGLLIQTIMK